MRRSGRLAAKGPSISMLIVSDDEEPEERGAASRSGSKRQQTEEETFAHSSSEGEEEDSESEKDSAVSLQRRASTASFPSSQTKRTVPLSPRGGRKKTRRSGQILPPLRNSFFSDAINSLNSWAELVGQENRRFKQRSKHIRTQFVKPITRKADMDDIQMAPLIQKTLPPALESLTLRLDTQTLQLSRPRVISNRLALTPTLTATLGFAVEFCECADCTSQPTWFVFFVFSVSWIRGYRCEFNRQGIQAVALTGEVSGFDNGLCSVVPESKRISVLEGSRLFVIDTAELHGRTGFTAMRLSMQNGLALSIPNSDSSTLVSAAWCPYHKGRLLVGTDCGRVFLFQVQSSVAAERIFQATLPIRRPIYSLAWASATLFFLAGKFPKVYSIDLDDPSVVSSAVSSLPLQLRVRWSPVLEAVIFADSDNHCRRFYGGDEATQQGQPIGTFDSTVLAMGVSAMHGVSATASASGAVQLSWMPPDPSASVEFEKRIMMLEVEEEPQSDLSKNDLSQGNLPQNGLRLSTEVSYVPFAKSDTCQLYDSKRVAATTVSWACNRNCPAVLAAGFVCGLVVLRVCDDLLS